jgi:fibro-slime domain-containing protein
MQCYRIYLSALALLIGLGGLSACSGDSGNTGGGGQAGAGGSAATGGVGGAGGIGGAGGDAGTGGNGGSGGVDPMDACGDSERQAIEACDDGNRRSNDGCAADCMMVEEGYRCPTPGAPCAALVCGDSRVDPPEQCDDNNSNGSDGCSASCMLEEGWVCLQPGVACSAAECGDGLVAGFEQCDDGHTSPNDGCSASCQLEDGFKCETPNAACVPTTCGDGQREGTEQCDDGNLTPFDGCDLHCKNEPDCTGGTCQAVCGDEVILPGTNEACDDGNTVGGDGCSAACEIEDGFSCTTVASELPSEFVVPVIYRDFRSRDGRAGITQTFNPDFNPPPTGTHLGITTEYLDVQGKPVWNASNPDVGQGGYPASAGSFAAWYWTSPSLVADGTIEVVGELTLGRPDPSNFPNRYQFASSEFFPLDDLGWELEAPPLQELPLNNGHNFGFTTEVHYFFVYQGDEVLSFEGDDDLWVFVDGRLCMDIGGIHGATFGTMSFDPMVTDSNAGRQAIVDACIADLGLQVGKVYEVSIFHAERHVTQSNFRLTLDGFVTEHSECSDTCGDGIRTRFEFCDDGMAQNTGEYGHCNDTCTALGEHCGDGVVQEEFEDCDNGENLGGANGCNSDCTTGPFCGDGIRQPELGESCDAAQQNGESGSGCSLSCEVVVE